MSQIDKTNKMNRDRKRYIVYALCLGGLILHLKTAFWESAEPFDSFSLKLLLGSLIPYVCIIIFRKASYGALCATIVVFLFDLFMHLEAFVWPSSSTAALGLLFMPIWNTVFFVPLSFLAGYFIQERINKKNIQTTHNKPIEADRE
jgi:hypothetical protein